jgi:hypothetical protein
MTMLVELDARELHDADALNSEGGQSAQLPAPLRQTVDKVFVRADVPLLVLVFR